LDGLKDKTLEKKTFLQLWYVVALWLIIYNRLLNIVADMLSILIKRVKNYGQIKGVIPLLSP
jgi:hypothetical protein